MRQLDVKRRLRRHRLTCCACCACCAIVGGGCLGGRAVRRRVWGRRARCVALLLATLANSIRSKRDAQRRRANPFMHAKPASRCPYPRIQFRIRAVLRHPSISNFNHPIAVARIDFGVRYLNNRCALLIQLLEELHDLLGLAGVQIPRGLIRQQQRRLVNHRARNAHQLLLSAGKLRRIQIFLADNLEAVERVSHEPLTLGRGMFL